MTKDKKMEEYANMKEKGLSLVKFVQESELEKNRKKMPEDSKQKCASSAISNATNGWGGVQVTKGHTKMDSTVL